MKPKFQMVLGLVLGVLFLVEGSSLFTAPSGDSPTRAFGIFIGITILIAAPCCFYMAWRGYLKSRSSDEDSH